MSRVGKNPVIVPEKVKVRLENGIFYAEGPKGKLHFNIPSEIDVNVTGKEIVVTRRDEEKKNIAMHGMVRAIINNLVVGVSRGFVKSLEIIGVGYKAESRGRELVLNLGYSHQINYPLPEGIEAKVEKGTSIAISGCDKQLVGEVAAKIRKLRPPEPYKGKGIRYSGEYVKHKVGKAAAAAGA